MNHMVTTGLSAHLATDGETKTVRTSLAQATLCATVVVNTRQL